MTKSEQEQNKYRPSFYKKALPVAKTILAVLWEIGKITTTSFFPPQYAKKYGYSSLYRNQYRDSLYYLKRSPVKGKHQWVSCGQAVFFQ